MPSRTGFATVVLLTCVFPAVSPAAADVARVAFRSGTVEVPDQPPGLVAHQLGMCVGRDAAPTRVLLTLDRSADAERRTELAAAGVHLLQPVAGRAYFAAVADVLDTSAVVAELGVTGVQPIRPEWKLHPLLAVGEFPDWSRVTLADSGASLVATYVVFHADVDVVAEGRPLVEALGGRVRDVLESINGLVVEAPEHTIGFLANEDAVQWIEPPLPRFVPINDSNRSLTQADDVQQAPYNLDGSGVTVLVYDGGSARATHLDFENRLFVGDTTPPDDHPTHVAGTIGGAGVVDPVYRGMAPGVDLLSYGYEYDGSGTFLYTNPGDLEADYDEAINDYGADISNNSIGTNTATNGFPCSITGDYGVTASVIDAVVRGAVSDGTPFRVIWANGNERQTSRCGNEYRTTAPPSCAKNQIAVGAVKPDDTISTFTSWGPTDDGRIKPDITAPGVNVTSCSAAGDSSYTTMSGTSMASPTVCGVAALLLQDYRTQFPAAPDPTNATLKALLAHTAADRGNVGPDYQFGYGSVRIREAVDHMRSGAFDENSLAAGMTRTYVVQVDATSEPVKATLTWDDYPATPNVETALVNDLDLVVIDPLGVRYYPWTLDPALPTAPAVRDREDHLNNVEQIVIDDPLPGTYLVHVRSYAIPHGPQTYTVTASPNLVSCVETGVVLLDRSEYRCTSTAKVTVNDCGLNTNPEMIETVLITASSDTDPNGLAVELIETYADSATFTGSIAIDTTPDPNTLLVTAGDEIAVTYLDADGGAGGASVPVSETATVDCITPEPLQVDISDVGTRIATVRVVTTEPARMELYYGKTCDNLDQVALDLSYTLSPTVILTQLEMGTEYAFAARIEDRAGNLRYVYNDAGCFAFTTLPPPTSFTEGFAPGNTPDIAGHSLRLTPDDDHSFYSGCVRPINRLPHSAHGGQIVRLTDNSTWRIPLDVHVSLYGESYEHMYVNSNGSISFNDGDAGPDATYAQHLSLPRISGLFSDLDPSSGGTIRYSTVEETLVVTFFQVRSKGAYTENTFQIVMSPDASIEIAWLDISVDEAIVGISSGGGLNLDFVPTDLSERIPCVVVGDADCNGLVDYFDINAFLMALEGPDAYAAEYPSCDWLQADCNGDGTVDYFDIDAFVEKLGG